MMRFNKFEILEIQSRMSDNDLDSEKPKRADKLGLQQIETSNNIFSYQQRSQRESSSHHSASDEDHVYGQDEDGGEEGERKGRKASKLSQVLGVDEVRDGEDPMRKSSGDGEALEVVGSLKEEEKGEAEGRPSIESEKLEEKKQQPVQKTVDNKEIAQPQPIPDPVKQPSTEPTQLIKPKEEQPKDPIQQVSQPVKEKQVQKQQPAKQQKEEKPSPIPQLKQLIHVPQKIEEIKAQTPIVVIEKAEIEAPKVQGQLKKSQSELQYNKELADEIADLKKNLIKKKKSQKEPQKSKLNKTVMPTTTHRDLQFDQTPQTKAMQLKMITTMAQEKKKQNYNRLKQWDKRRAQALAIHRNMIQILQSQIDKRIKSSIQNLQIYTTFLREKARQEQKYVAHPVINTKYALQNNSISKSVYINCTVILNSLSDQNNARCRKINDFVHLIRNDILRDSVEVHLMQSQKELLRVREKISGLKAALRKCNAETEEKTGELALFFSENSVNMNVESERDFFSTQLEFLQKASQQTLIQKKLGEHCLEYLHTAVDEEMKRSKVIREAMITFSKALEQCYNIDTDPAQIQQLSKAEQTKLIEQFYSLEQIFDERCLTVFKSHEGIPHQKMLTIDMFTNFLKKFEFEGFDSRVILLKQFNVRYHPSSKTETNTEQNCYIVITVDKWIHLFLSKQKTDAYTKPDVSIRATMRNLEIKTAKTQMLDLVIKDEKRNSMISYFWESKNDRTYRIQFQKKDAREEFIDYVTKLRG